MLSNDKVKRTAVKLKPNPRNALGKEEMTEKITIPEPVICKEFYRKSQRQSTRNEFRHS
ncbi:hypothetical protein VAE151_630063 [Vibrio aestuarianus]|uniref:Uncharacterized protein n=1 Tax=Vibrio aestuarianus TaxID=28171 RepID=A0ABM9FHD5_9VIBR|nr:hypothetical protein VAE063_1000062 [Vibrio aestuarianus]CAH8218163.1 hypothetical protein VIBAE_B10148 [Vibrio aestuarianus subsp. francensis]CAH8219579.1 hypothetical protein VAE055_420063 [Vibrio aestuarianus]CAH8219732.1 hypothetical protein VAE032_320062 [Vibrio aestuarianus]CAH8219853.1 hypothetical protein VAE128_500059 [Vibrio aestuarianus]